MAKKRGKTNKTTELKGSVSGGKKLRLLREKCGLSQFDLELEGIITQANYSRIERGLATPTQETLEQFFALLKADFYQSQEILKAFGYLPPVPLPDEQEMEAVRQRCQPILDALTVPAFLIDQITRLVTYNALMVKLAGDHSDVLAQLRGKPLFKVQFASHLRLCEFMDDMDAVLLDAVQAIRTRLEPYRDQQWYLDIVADLCEEPAFQRYWDEATASGPPEPVTASLATRILHPVRFDLPDADGAVLRFYTNPEPLLEDNRFHIVHLTAENAFTLRQIERWREAP